MIKDLLIDLRNAIKERKYDKVERVGNLMLETSPSEEADRCIHEIISSANTIRDAEDEIYYQLEELKAALEAEPDETEREVDGL